MRRPLAVVPCAVLAAAVGITGCGSGSKTASSTAGTSAAGTSSAATTSAGAAGTTSAAASASTTGAAGTTSAAPKSTSAAASPATKALLAKTKAAFIAAPGVHVTGATTDAGQAVRVDLSYSRGGAKGSVTEQGVTLDFVVLGHEVYFKAPNSYWKKTLAGKPAALKKVEGKWVKGADTATGFTELAQIGNRTSYASTLFKPTGTLTVTPAKTVNGQPCVGLKDQTGTLYVAKSGSRPVETVQTGGPGRVVFSYISVPTPKAPPAADTVTTAQVAG